MTMGGRSTSGRHASRIVEPAREVLEASAVEGAWQLEDPTARVVEVHDDDADTVYVLEPVPTPVTAGPNPVDTTGSQPGNVLRAGSDGVYRPAPTHDHWPHADDIRIGGGPPIDTAPWGAVHVDVASGHVYRYGGTA